MKKSMMFTLSQEAADNFNAILGGDKEKWPLKWPDDDEMFLVKSVDFGEGWEADMNIVKGQPTPYLDVTLYHKGCEVYGWELSENVIGEWEVTLDSGEYFRLRSEIL